MKKKMKFNQSNYMDFVVIGEQGCLALLRDFETFKESFARNIDSLYLIADIKEREKRREELANQYTYWEKNIVPHTNKMLKLVPKMRELVKKNIKD